MKNKISSLLVLGSVIMISCNDSYDLNTKVEKAEYSGKDISGDASIIRNKDVKTAVLDIITGDKWALYSGISVSDIDFSKPIAEGDGSGVFPLNVPDNIRSYFQLVTSEGKAILSERHLPMTGGYNFRDLGGFKTLDGKFTKWGQIFRSDDLYNLTDADLRYLSSIPLVSIVDFRSSDEINSSPDKVPASVTNKYAYSMMPGKLSGSNLIDLNENQIDSAMMDMNVLLVTDPICINRYKDFFALLQQENNTPLLFHCSAGKDRAGMATALILFALGVDENTIIEDYLSSNRYLADKYAQYIAQMPALKSLFEVKREFIEAGLDRIKKDHGSIENYLTEILGVNSQKFREKYLY